jgi:hypothetical protein
MASARENGLILTSGNGCVSLDDRNGVILIIGNGREKLTIQTSLFNTHIINLFAIYSLSTAEINKQYHTIL